MRRDCLPHGSGKVLLTASKVNIVLCHSSSGVPHEFCQCLYVNSVYHRLCAKPVPKAVQFDTVWQSGPITKPPHSVAKVPAVPGRLAGSKEYPFRIWRLLLADAIEELYHQGNKLDYPRPGRSLGTNGLVLAEYDHPSFQIHIIPS